MSLKQMYGYGNMLSHCTVFVSQLMNYLLEKAEVYINSFRFIYVSTNHDFYLKYMIEKDINIKNNRLYMFILQTSCCT